MRNSITQQDTGGWCTAHVSRRLLCNKWVMDIYKNLPGVDDTFTNKYPSQDKWWQLADFEAVISPIQKCAISIQTDDPATNSGHFWKYILHDVKLKECDPPMQQSCP